jgi:predicted amidohydrolase
MEDVRVAAVVMRSAAGRKPENLARTETFVRQAAAQGAQAICFPELNITGYSLQPKMASLAETIPGPSTKALLQMAREYHMLILAGLVEAREGEEVSISHLAAGPGGLLGIYRKIHLGPAEEGIYQAGDECLVFEYGGTIFGIELCFDAHFPELSTILALKGAEVIFIPHASPRESSEDKQARWLRYLSARAYDNSVYVVACNQVGENEMGLNFSGVALILTPRGEVMAANQGLGEEMIYANLKKADLKGVRESPRGYFLPRRRPAIYKELRP